MGKIIGITLCAPVNYLLKICYAMYAQIPVVGGGRQESKAAGYAMCRRILRARACIVNLNVAPQRFLHRTFSSQVTVEFLLR